MARILVIDDEAPLRMLLRRALEGRGHEVVEAREGREGLRLLRTASADLVITDIHMPDRDGIEVLMELRHGAPDLKVIAMSGGGRVMSHEQALEMATPLGAFATLAKPFSLEALFEVVERALAA